ncbi:sensor histidine kinase [Mucilaginibacter polytrichastri]|uniref:histidine kinase n=1 Tax=Mucilaginibacter polytrichastri TaxID=1302689 RepID=A0A1Q6A068_9SPHI|nr:ATP-binding protein [Mucilaginibacter polytrichastri]OKS87410.1 hypothetical protein RG47T_2871 [Mucilaginibacter polytrichastri]SFS90292.1 His Kinase A (phospho-acceptor) domain-containing protein [Mucilaginibacter polytrichastri]
MKVFKLICVLLLLISFDAAAQKNTFPEAFKITADTAASLNIPDANWQYLLEKKPLTIAQVSSPEYSTLFKKNDKADKSYQEYWVRYKVKNTLNKVLEITILGRQDAAIFISGSDGKWHYYRTGFQVPWSQRDGLKKVDQIIYKLPAGNEITVYKRDICYSSDTDPIPIIGFKDAVLYARYVNNDSDAADLFAAVIFGILLFAALINLFFFYIIREKVYLLYSIMLVLGGLSIFSPGISLLFREYPQIYFYGSLFPWAISVGLSILVTLMFLDVRHNYPRLYKLQCTISLVLVIALLFLFINSEIRVLKGYDYLLEYIIALLVVVSVLSIIVISIIDWYKKRRSAGLFMLAVFPFFVFFISSFFLPDWFNVVLKLSIIWAVVVISWSLFNRYKGVLNLSIQQSLDKERLLREKEEERNELIAKQNDLLEQQVTERTAELQHSLENLKKAQTQLVQSEKMASLGELTAGIAHEIQNPLNFVNNFSDVNREMIDELKEELKAGNVDEALAIANDIQQNEEKIIQHGKRADNIVKGMLQHSRSNTGERQISNINTIADEFLKLSYHGLRAKDKSFNADLTTHFYDNLPLINIVAQDIGRVLLNLFNNAFYAVNQQKKTKGAEYKPEVSVATGIENGYIVVTVTDNGIGIPNEIKDKIMQPFFTTKPSGEGTGLGLSLSYDIVVKGHGGKIEILSEDGSYTRFEIRLPV